MRRSAIALTLIVMVVALMAGIGAGHACGGAGDSPTNSFGSCESSGNVVTCGGTGAGGITVAANANGAEVCSSGTAPVHGRVGAEGPACDCVYADGSAGNPAPLDGWVRIDQGGAHCDTAGQQSYNSGAGSTCP
ncbi:MAG: hypothetical protein ABR552_00675 [Actinomycetota bacterium]|nr:hypothetical protein [Actinomycetota bacterium]